MPAVVFIKLGSQRSTMSDTAKKILIAEDEKPIAKALELKLQHEGFDVTTVFNGEEALEYLEKGTFAILLLDLVMPKVDGFKVLETLQIKKNSTPVFILSNLSQQEDEVKAKKLGAQGFFIKSNTPLAQIVSEVKRILN